MPNDRNVRLMMALFILLHLILLFASPLLPFTDLPNHLAEATVYKYSGTGNLIDQYYTSVPGFYPNTFHTVFCSLFPSVEFGNKVFYALFAAGLLLSTYAVLRELGGNTYYALFSVLYIFNYNTTWGFSGFTIALPTTLALFYVTLRHNRAGGAGNLVVAAVLLVLLYLMHAQVALFGLLLFGAMMLYRHWGEWKAFFLKSVLVCLPVVVMVFIWWGHRTAEVQEESTASFLANYYANRYFPEFRKRFLLIIFDHYAMFAGAKGKAVALLFTGLLLLPLLVFRAWKRVPGGGLKNRQWAYPLMLAVLSFGCYILLPSELPGQGPLHERFCTLVFLSLIILGGVLLREVRGLGLQSIVLLSALAYTTVWAQYLYSFNRENRGFTAELFEGFPQENILMGLIYDHTFRDRPVYFHFPNYYIVRHGGLAGSKMIDYRFGVVRRREPKGAEIPLYEEWLSGADYKVPSNYGNISYFLVRGKAPIQPDANLAGARKVREGGPWAVWQKARLR